MPVDDHEARLSYLNPYHYRPLRDEASALVYAPVYVVLDSHHDLGKGLHVFPKLLNCVGGCEGKFRFVY